MQGSKEIYERVTEMVFHQALIDVMILHERRIIHFNIGGVKSQMLSYMIQQHIHNRSTDNFECTPRLNV